MKRRSKRQYSQRTRVPQAMAPEDRASLLRRRRQIRRSKENASSKSNVSYQPQQAHELLSSSAETGATTTKPLRTRKKSPVTKDTAEPVQHPAVVKKKASASSVRSAAGAGAAEPNVALLIRQVLQRPHYGDLVEYLNTASKEQLFEQTLLIARFAIEVGYAYWLAPFY